ncbi:MAG: hypothetical protein Q4F84_10145, partial [Fibrobacter sp.]|nr:hypothetical protein [Fibrobacter sp.]
QPIPGQNQGFEDPFNSYLQYQPAQNGGYAPEIEEEHIETFEPQNSFNNAAPQKPEQKMDDYYDYGNISLQPMNGNSETNNIGSSSIENDYSSMPQPMADPFQAAGNDKTDLDLEIEKYQREIEEKQRAPRSGAAPVKKDTSRYQTPFNGQNQAPAAPSFNDNMNNQYNMQHGADEEDYDVYNLEVSFPPSNSSEKQFDTPVEDSDDMYFTSVDTNHQKKPLRRPVNPRTQQQKGFLSKLFNKDTP